MDFVHLAFFNFVNLKTYLNNPSKQCTDKIYDIWLNDKLPKHVMYTKWGSCHLKPFQFSSFRP